MTREALAILLVSAMASGDIPLVNQILSVLNALQPAAAHGQGNRNAG